MPQNLLDCALVYYNTFQELLKQWGKDTDENRLGVMNRFIETLHTIEFVFVPAKGFSFFNIYQHIKKVNKNKKVHQILKEYKTLKGKIRRKEKAMLHRWNLLLAMVAYRQIKNRVK